MTINWQDVGVQTGIATAILTLYHQFIFDNQVRKALKEDEGAQSIVNKQIMSIVKQEIEAFRKEEVNSLARRIDALQLNLSNDRKERNNEIKDLSKDLSKVARLLEVRMAKRKAEIAEMVTNVQTLSQFISYSISALGSTVFNWKRRSEDFIKHYNLHNQGDHDFHLFFDHTHENEYTRFLDNLFSPPDPLTRAIASKKQADDDSGFFPQPSYKDTHTGEDTTQDF